MATFRSRSARLLWNDLLLTAPVEWIGYLSFFIADCKIFTTCDYTSWMVCIQLSASAVARQSTASTATLPLYYTKKRAKVNAGFVQFFRIFQLAACLGKSIFPAFFLRLQTCILCRDSPAFARCVRWNANRFAGGWHRSTIYFIAVFESDYHYTWSKHYEVIEKSKAFWGESYDAVLLYPNTATHVGMDEDSYYPLFIRFLKRGNKFWTVSVLRMQI